MSDMLSEQLRMKQRDRKPWKSFWIWAIKGLRNKQPGQPSTQFDVRDPKQPVFSLSCCYTHCWFLIFLYWGSLFITKFWVLLKGEEDGLQWNHQHLSRNEASQSTRAIERAGAASLLLHPSHCSGSGLCLLISASAYKWIPDSCSPIHLSHWSQSEWPFINVDLTILPTTTYNLPVSPTNLRRKSMIFSPT